MAQIRKLTFVIGGERDSLLYCQKKKQEPKSFRVVYILDLILKRECITAAFSVILTQTHICTSHIYVTHLCRSGGL